MSHRVHGNLGWVGRISFRPWSQRDVANQKEPFVGYFMRRLRERRVYSTIFIINVWVGTNERFDLGFDWLRRQAWEEVSSIFDGFRE
jgi:hypothetical protein